MAHPALPKRTGDIDVLKREGERRMSAQDSPSNAPESKYTLCSLSCLLPKTNLLEGGIQAVEGGFSERERYADQGNPAVSSSCPNAQRGNPTTLKKSPSKLSIKGAA